MRRLVTYLLTLAVLVSCSPKHFPPVEIVRTVHDTVAVAKIRVDSVFSHDSVFIREKGDTVYEYREKIRERYRLIHDTTYIHRTDTLHQTVVREVEKELTKGQKRMIRGFWVLLAALAAVLAWKVYQRRKGIWSWVLTIWSKLR